MNPPRSEGFVRMPDAEFEAILTRAAEEGAKRALADVGLDGDEAALDIRDLRSLVDCIRLVRRTAMQTAVRMIAGRSRGDRNPEFLLFSACRGSFRRWPVLTRHVTA